ncbi:MAG: alpha/beta hydrolase [Deltaproteobacteria bacterium]|nr:alpha/beta hydrolase [Deltaproteobacteria bacterium]
MTSTRATISDLLSLPDVEVSERFVQVEPEVRLRVLSWVPRQAAPGARPLLFVAGWVSAVDGWLDLLRALAPSRPVHYLETREKRSALIAEGAHLGPERFDIARMAEDLVVVAHELGLDARAVAMGSSLGATVLLEALKGSRLKLGGAFLIGPNVRFRYPWWGHLVVRLPAPLYYWVARPPVLFYLRHFRVDAKHEPEQMRRYEVTLREAHPARIKLSAMAFSGYEVWPEIASVQTPVAVAFARSDSLHGEDDVRRLLAALPRGVAVPCISNKHMHFAALAEDLLRFEAAI